ncbi:MAG: toll/interleukin-1 receptor domain-containing protein, partial [Gammaproteobacteria bacterium]|nr:toll/interleukin-1 receptor domain-containing protein [Gammaproteobacteria bacterium]
MTDHFTTDIFLSHNTKDKPQVRRLAEKLRDAGLNVWFDEWAVRPGDDIYLAIERGLEAARVQILCLSPAALGSDWVTLERNTVLFRDPTNADRRFIPLLLADCELPDTLRRYKYVDFRQESEEAFAELLAACTPVGEHPTQQISIRNGKKPVGSGERRLARETEPTT